MTMFVANSLEALVSSNCQLVVLAIGVELLFKLSLSRLVMLFSLHFHT